jgi:Ca2+-binding RTX toxin-like protein
LNNKRSLTINIVISTTLAIIFGITMTGTNNSVWAATIHCPNPPDDRCEGTEEGDVILGTSKEDSISGLGGDDNMFGFASNDFLNGNDGDDTMSGGSGDDDMVGGNGDDNINGDSGDDAIIGGGGADILKGSSGNDRILHGGFRSDFPIETSSDGSQDTIDCGSGNNDVAFINVSRDHDTAINCETVHTENNPF